MAEAAEAASTPADEIEIKFTIQPEGFTHSRRFAPGLTLVEMKAQVEEDLRIPVASMKLVHCEQEMTSPLLADYAFKMGEPNDIELQIVFHAEHSTPSSYVMPDVISVEVRFGADIPPKLIQVPIVRAMPAKKPFLGGYRSRKTHLEYHHASSQTDRAPRQVAEDEVSSKFHRETQTAVLQTRSQQSVREAGTQMPRGHLGEEEGDVVVRPLPYFTSEQHAELRLEKAIDLQRYTRGWFSRATAAALRNAQAAAAAAAALEAERQKAEAEERHKLEIQRRMHPHTKDDFDILYTELEAWRMQETSRIKDDPEMDEHSRLDALQQLLLKEQKLLQTIDRLRLQADDENQGNTPEQWERL